MCSPYLNLPGHDIEGAMAAIAATHEVAIETTRQVLPTCSLPTSLPIYLLPPYLPTFQVLAALEAFGDVISLDGELHVRLGTDLNEPPPLPPLPVGA